MISNLDTANLPSRIARRLQSSLPGATASRTMEPELSYGRHSGPAHLDARPAAVVALLHWVDGQWKLPLIVRPDSLSNHAGQISLPGGLLEPGESSEEAALRELEEELGIARFSALLLGVLSPIYLYGTNFLITPWVAALHGQAEFVPSAAEVQEILEAPLSLFVDPSSRGQHVEERGSIRFWAPHFDWLGNRIWGATGMILAELAAVVADVATSTDSR